MLLKLSDLATWFGMRDFTIYAIILKRRFLCFDYFIFIRLQYDFRFSNSLR